MSLLEELAKENLNGVIHHFKIAGIEDDACRIAMPEANINAIAERIHPHTPQRSRLFCGGVQQLLKHY